MAANTRRSLRVRVTVAVSALMSVALLVAALAAAGLMRRGLETDTEVVLSDRLDEAVTSVRTAGLPRQFSRLGGENVLVVITDASGTVLSATPGRTAPRPPPGVAPPAPGERVTTTTTDGVAMGGDPGQRYRLVAETVLTPDGAVTVWAAASLRPADRAVRTLALIFVGTIPTLVALATLLTWRAVTQSLEPVEQMRSALDALGTTLDGRIRPPTSDDEIAALARTLNGLLDRLEVAANRERRFAADASHELRSPLAAARAQLEVALAYPDRAAWADVARDTLSEIERLERLSRGLLALARADTAGRRAPVDLAAVVRSACATARAGIELRLSTVPVTVSGDADLLERVVGNVVDNARRHARSVIEIDLGTEGDRALVRIGNDGPAVDAADRERIFEPFTRLDDARSTEDGGAGIGLAIARQIAVQHGGTLTVTDRDPEGVTFELRLPLARAD